MTILDECFRTFPGGERSLALVVWGWGWIRGKLNWSHTETFVFSSYPTWSLKGTDRSNTFFCSWTLPTCEYHNTSAFWEEETHQHAWSWYWTFCYLNHYEQTRLIFLFPFWTALTNMRINHNFSSNSNNDFIPNLPA